MCAVNELLLNTPYKPRPVSHPKRRQEILSVAVQVFAARGYRIADVQEIADIAGVGKGTIYRAFASKEGLFYAAVDHCMHRLNEAMLDSEQEMHSTDAPTTYLRAKILAFLTFFQNNEEIIELLMQERSEFKERQGHSYARNWLMSSSMCRRRIESFIHSGKYRKLSVDGLIIILNDVLYGAIFTHYFSKDKINLERTADLIADIILNGVLNHASEYMQFAPDSVTSPSR